MNKLTLVALATAIFLVGCFNLVAGGIQGLGKAQLVVTPQIIDGGLATQAVVNNYSQASINHLVIKIFQVNGNTETPVMDGSNVAVTKDVLNANLSDTITFDHLSANTTYRVRCFAYKAAGTANEDLISTSDAASYVDITLTNDDRPTMATLRVKLIDVPFSGTASSNGVAVTEGGYSSSQPVTIQ